MPAWQKERAHVLSEILQLCLEEQYSAGVSCMLDHGANPSEVSLAKLCHMLVDPEQCRYPLFVPVDLPSAPLADDEMPDAGLAERQGERPQKTVSKRLLTRRDRVGRKRGPGSEHPALDHYLEDVWDLVRTCVPGFSRYWKQKVKPRALDLYLWAVLLGNCPLAMSLLPACQVRAPPLAGALRCCCGSPAAHRLVHVLAGADPCWASRRTHLQLYQEGAAHGYP